MTSNNLQGIPQFCSTYHINWTLAAATDLYLGFLLSKSSFFETFSFFDKKKLISFPGDLNEVLISFISSHWTDSFIASVQ